MKQKQKQKSTKNYPSCGQWIFEISIIPLNALCCLNNKWKLIHIPCGVSVFRGDGSVCVSAGDRGDLVNS